MIRPDWIAVDWGTSRLRAWAMSASGELLAEATSDDGMSRVDHTGFEPALLALISPWLGSGQLPVLACGMVGARQGWAEVGYQSVPAKPGDLDPFHVTATDPRLKVMILPGLSQTNPPDVMRGEETQIAGFLVKDPEFDGVLCLPGTHSKWVRISAEEVVSFQTAMTGELYHLLSTQSVISHVLKGDGPEDEAAFLEAVSDMMSKPEALAQRLFAIRADAVLNGISATTSRSRMTGYLIGAELAATRPYWLGQRVAVAAEPMLADLYGRALTAQGAWVEIHDAGPLTRAGLSAAFAKLPETI